MNRREPPKKRALAKTAFLILLISSCAGVTYDFIGQWTQKAGTLTYVNRVQHIQVSFPDDRWQVYTEPSSPYLKAIWSAPSKDRPAFHVLHAEVSELGTNLQIEIEPVSEDLDLGYYLAVHTQRLERVRGIEVLSSYVTVCGDCSVGLTVVKGTSETHGAKGMKMLTGIFKEEGRFTLLTLACPDALFESGKEQFWEIVDSYEYLE